ncbi:ankyrin repeat domain-containing protein [Anaerosacchariphilus polymeriproducens]|uniref:ankyrin repeat domain-containing protein n=1 Tax=Anaerosacchariphilus polymeriproducens TaxID=1812858 RepID=UPI00187B9F4A|nr:ankyrin repeat domain-containing protein [Anaerosacchariphilus polymeriproducens]
MQVDLIDVDETENVGDLKKKLKSDDRQVIVTTIQELQRQHNGPKSIEDETDSCAYDNETHMLKVLFPACANCDITIFDYILGQLPKLCNPSEYIQHTLRFRHHIVEYEEKQVAIIAQLFTYVDADKKQQVLNDALVLAVWFGEYKSVKYLIQQGADVTYQTNGRSMLELAQNAIVKFNDCRVEKFILANI